MKKLGFVIVNQAEEFLSSYSIKPDYVSKSWARIPDLARRFKTIKEADKVVARLCSKYPLYVFGLEDLGRHYALYAPRDGSYPDWFAGPVSH